MDGTISLNKFQELLARVKAGKNVTTEAVSVSKISEIQKSIETEVPISIDLRNVGITQESLQTIEGHENAIEVLSDITDMVENESMEGNSPHKTGVAAEVSLNTKQQAAISTALSGDDLCLIGAAGTGKTTTTGKYIAQLLAEGNLPPLESASKWVKQGLPGVLITSFTRKAVNNIRRAVPGDLKLHTQTMHKFLEFGPVFYELYDEKSKSMKKTMKFEPARGALNPLPEGIQLVIYEESSMIGTDLYNMMAAALPHKPQEIFIGDIRQLPPIFGPAILGFKMSLLPVVELTEVYRQALLSPIIRLAHAVLSGDASKFNSDGKYVEEEPHPHVVDPKTGKPKVTKRTHIPKLEVFNEESPEHGTVFIQPWQKKLGWETAVDATIKQFIAWSRTGYYNPEEDIILCPFNKSFGTIELNKGIQNYLGLQRGAVVHEVIAGFEKLYLAVGDRVLYDKEDAVVEEIKKNVNYMGKAPQIASIHLDRWGCLQEELSEEELQKASQENEAFDMDAINKFMEVYEDGEDRVNQASHSISIRFSYSDESLVLSSAGEVNNLLGGNAITVHKMQGSENEAIFFVLHDSHAAMVNNELLYTGITRARKKLHIICEQDTFFKGVRTHKVRGSTLKEKIKFFQGKGEFAQMQAEMELLQRFRVEKVMELESKKRHAEQTKKIPKETPEDDYLECDYIQLANTEYPSDRDIYPEMDSRPPEEHIPTAPIKVLTPEEKMALIRQKMKAALRK